MDQRYFIQEIANEHMTAAITTKRHHNKIKFIATAPLVGTVLLYHSSINLFYSYVCYRSDSLYATPQWKPGKEL